jgi:mono/diheme cytochrome c family protein
MRALRLGLGIVVVTSSAFAAGGCTRPGGPDAVLSGFGTGAGSGGSASDGGHPSPDASSLEVVQRAGTCVPARSSERLAPRSTIVDQTGPTTTRQVYFTETLYGLFHTVCGGCHGEQSGLGGFSVSFNDFTDKVTPDVLAQIESDNDRLPKTYMPPPGGPGAMPWSQRLKDSPNDAVAQLGNLLEIWLAQGSPASSFTLPTMDDQTTSATYTMTSDLAAQLTNIGSCVPDRDLVGKNAALMDDLDAKFASATSLPPTLDQTDLTTLDSHALAETGVISYAPTYPLWTDGAGKMRYVRVPRGQSIKLDKAKQTLQIPPNTRFYKTFLKPVVDANGNPSFRKIETRVIVSRPDRDSADGPAQQTALYGTYVWNDDETSATLLTDPLRNGRPFADRIFTYITDERRAADVAAKNPRDLLTALRQAGLTRHYALPGAERCVQCHMGSPSQSFILGFTPLQVARRAAGTGGTYEEATGDELTQLQRLIDYGVITGVTSPADVLPLERSQGDRAPRNDHELAAQAYMVGNCAHCHNPRGFPSIKQPLIKDSLILLPGAGPSQGIFQFPLDRVSPIRRRGLFQDVPIAYVTPSLYDLPGQGYDKYFCPKEDMGSCAGTGRYYEFVVAPWRSLIYRNVDTPYDYFDDFAIFPHMPLNSPGYDCRAAQIIGDWMVSIPAVEKDPGTFQNAIPTWDGSRSVYGNLANRDVQPYVEVPKGDPGYAAAVDAAQTRLDQYHAGKRYDFCPKTYTEDIVDPVIEGWVNDRQPVLSDSGPLFDPGDVHKMTMPIITPLRPHFVSFDDTEPPGDWFPRRPDWPLALANPDIPTFIQQAMDHDHLDEGPAVDLTNVLETLQDIKLTPELRAALTTQVPFGLWKTAGKSCDLSAAPKAGSFAGANRPAWMDATQAPADAPVFMQSPGASVFTTICFNCHGPNADSNGLLSDEITNLTGGDARVADFRDGLFGPVSSPGENRARVFGPVATMLGGGLDADDLGARYLAWMALGGTEKHLPEDVLTQVSQAPVLGLIRNHLNPEGTPDMLKLGLQLCQQVASSTGNASSLSLRDLFTNGSIKWSASTGLIDSNGDAEMWLRICNLGNRAIVRVPLVNGGQWKADTSPGDVSVAGSKLYWGTGTAGQDLYGPNPVMDQHGKITTGLTADNQFPLCMQRPGAAAEALALDQWLQTHKVGGNVVPYCPPGFVAPERLLQTSGSGTATDFVDGKKWAVRGAVNAALAVFLYLDQIERDPTKRSPFYDQCELLGKAP